MEYSKLISVTGLPGLYELISSRNDGALVRSLEDKSTRFVSSRVHNFSHLESIEVYTTADNVNLAEVFQAMKASGEKMPDEKDAAAVKKYFATVFHTMDLERVYNSDMKKMIRWFGILQKNDVEIVVRTEEDMTEEVTEAPAPEAKEKPARKSSKAKAATEAVAEEPAPAKKSSKKSKD
jgi:hypothetical protein